MDSKNKYLEDTVMWSTSANELLSPFVDEVFLDSESLESEKSYFSHEATQTENHLFNTSKLLKSGIDTELSEGYLEYVDKEIGENNLFEEDEYLDENEDYLENQNDSQEWEEMDELESDETQDFFVDALVEESELQEENEDYLDNQNGPQEWEKMDELESDENQDFFVDTLVEESELQEENEDYLDNQNGSQEWEEMDELESDKDQVFFVDTLVEESELQEKSEDYLDNENDKSIETYLLGEKNNDDYKVVHNSNNNGLSPIAIQADKQWNAIKDRPTRWIGNVYGLVVHTTGGSLPGRAIKNDVYPTLQALNWYTRRYKSKKFHGGCHYVNGWQGIQGGDLFQIANERERAWGVGVGDQRRSINMGQFETDLPINLVENWRKRWPEYDNSLSLLPKGESQVNSCYIHVECIPVLYFINGKTFISETHPPMRAGLRFTQAQHDAIANLACDIAIRNDWPLDDEWWRTPRLLGHEDFTPLTRKNKNGGYDPGYLRDNPYFDWDYIYEKIKKIRGNQYKLSGRKSTAINKRSNPTHSLIQKGKQIYLYGKAYYFASTAISNGERNALTITDKVFYDLYPDKKGKRLSSKDPLVKTWKYILNVIVKPMLKKESIKKRLPSKQPPNSYGKYPDGYKTKRRKGRITGLSRYADERLDKKLISMRERGIINITNDELDIMQRIANVETAGKIQGINTWDSAVVSMGFMQLTLQHGKIQKWINKITSIFMQYGIELTENKSYEWRKRSKRTGNLVVNKQHGIVNATMSELRWSPWVEKFYNAAYSGPT